MFVVVTVVALYGYHATIVERPTPELVIKAMMLQPQLQYWILAGHGNGGTVAAHVAVTLHPKVEALILLASPLPRDVNLKLLNLLLVVAYSENDTLVTSAAVKRSFSRMAGRTSPQCFLQYYRHPVARCVVNQSTVDNNAVEKTGFSLPLRSLVVSLGWCY